MNAYSVLVLHHQFVSEEGTTPGIVNPSAGKQFGGLEVAAKSARYSRRSWRGEVLCASLEGNEGRASTPPMAPQPKNATAKIQAEESISEAEAEAHRFDWRPCFKYRC